MYVESQMWNPLVNVTFRRVEPAVCCSKWISFGSLQPQLWFWTKISQMGFVLQKPFVWETHFGLIELFSRCARSCGRNCERWYAIASSSTQFWPWPLKFISKGRNWARNWKVTPRPPFCPYWQHGRSIKQLVGACLLPQSQFQGQPENSCCWFFAWKEANKY